MLILLSLLLIDEQTLPWSGLDEAYLRFVTSTGSLEDRTLVSGLGGQGVNFRIDLFLFDHNTRLFLDVKDARIPSGASTVVTGKNHFYYCDTKTAKAAVLDLNGKFLRILRFSEFSGSSELGRLVRISANGPERAMLTSIKNGFFLLSEMRFDQNSVEILHGFKPQNPEYVRFYWLAHKQGLFLINPVTTSVDLVHPQSFLRTTLRQDFEPLEKLDQKMILPQLGRYEVVLVNPLPDERGFRFTYNQYLDPLTEKRLKAPRKKRLTVRVEGERLDDGIDTFTITKTNKYHLVYDLAEGVFSYR